MLVKPNINSIRSGHMAKKVEEMKFCEHCNKETLHVVREDALEIEFLCTECNEQSDVIKTFF
jgi:ribosomal protein L33